MSRCNHLSFQNSKRKKPEIGLITGFFVGGGRGIRTHVPFHRQLDFESSSL